MGINELENQLTELQKIKSKAVKELNYDLAASSRDKIKVLNEVIKQTKIMKENVYILGMAKSSIKFNTSGPRRNLELDVLRLIHFVNLFAVKEVKVFAVMLVHNEEIKNLICGKWFEKYHFENTDYFKVITYENNEHYLNNKTEILIEKKNNSDFNNSSAILSEKITEEILRNEIEKDFKIEKLHEIQDKFLGVKWDFKRLYKV